MSVIPTDLRAKLTAATSFQGAAMAGLEAMLKIVEDCIAQSEYAGEETTVLRGMAHLRYGDDYQGMAVRTWKGDIEGEMDIVPSATLWGAVKRTRKAAAFDVVRGAEGGIRPGGRNAKVAKLVVADGGGLPQASQSRMFARDVTHVLALPIVVDKLLRGMLSFEVKCKAAIGRKFVWTGCIQNLQIITSMMGPALVSLPLESTGDAPVEPFLPVLGVSMVSRMDTLRHLAEQRWATLLLTGPTGVGKTALARWCHENSPRREFPFQTISLHQMTSEAVLKALFGTEDGSGAPGMVEEAKGGTLFIDDIDMIPVKSQPAVLQLLSGFTYHAGGADGGDLKDAEVRVIVATSRDLEGLAGRGVFPKDLYHRIHVLSFRVPPLSDRMDEVGDWARYFLGELDSEATISEDAITALESYNWPGNLAQLEDVIGRASGLAGTGSGAVELGVDQMNEALTREGEESGPKAYQLFEDAADAFVTSVLAHNRLGKEPLALDLIEGIGRLVVDGLMERGGFDLKEAFLALGELKTVEHRNHGRRYDSLGDVAKNLRSTLKGG